MEEPRASSRPFVTNAALFAGAGVLIGAAVGWFLRDARDVSTTPDVAATAVPASAGSACPAWERALCAEVGADSGDCKMAKGAAQIMPDKACASALTEVKTTADELKKGRAVCDQLADKLCKDIGEGSPQTCGMIKKRMAAMPTPVCEERQQNYPMLVNQLKQLANPARRRPPPAAPSPHGPGDGHDHGHDGHGHDH